MVSVDEISAHLKAKQYQDNQVSCWCGAQHTGRGLGVRAVERIVSAHAHFPGCNAGAHLRATVGEVRWAAASNCSLTRSAGTVCG